MPLIERTPGSLPPGHRCRVDDLAYNSVSDWFNDQHGHVPIRAAAGLDRFTKATGSTFAEAFTALSGKGGPIILIEEEDGLVSAEARTPMHSRGDDPVRHDPPLQGPRTAGDYPRGAQHERRQDARSVALRRRFDGQTTPGRDWLGRGARPASLVPSASSHRTASVMLYD